LNIIKGLEDKLKKYNLKIEEEDRKRIVTDSFKVIQTTYYEVIKLVSCYEQVTEYVKTVKKFPNKMLFNMYTVAIKGYSKVYAPLLGESGSL
jgi:hypothetical protein